MSSQLPESPSGRAAVGAAARAQCLIALCLLLGAGVTAAEEVTDQRLLAAGSDPGNWLSYGRDYANQRFSPLTQIDTGNVRRLAPRWVCRSGVTSTFQASPIVVDGVMYVSLPFDPVVATAGGLLFVGEGDGDFSAFDSGTGALLWQYRCEAGVNAPPVTCSLDGTQYVAVAVGGSQIFGYRQGDMVHVFALEGD